MDFNKVKDPLVKGFLVWRGPDYIDKVYPQLLPEIAEPRFYGLDCTSAVQNPGRSEDFPYLPLTRLFVAANGEEPAS